MADVTRSDPHYFVLGSSDLDLSQAKARRPRGVLSDDFGLSAN